MLEEYRTRPGAKLTARDEEVLKFLNEGGFWRSKVVAKNLTCRFEDFLVHCKSFREDIEAEDIQRGVYLFEFKTKLVTERSLRTSGPELNGIEETSTLRIEALDSTAESNFMGAQYLANGFPLSLCSIVR